MRLLSSALAVLLLAGSSGCAGSPDTSPLESADANALTWVAPTTDQTIYADDVITLAVSTGNTAAQSVEFTVDGMPLGTCADDCRDENIFSFTTTIHGVGLHVFRASFRDAAGAAVTAERSIDAQASVSPTIPPSASGGSDPTLGGSTAPTVPAGSPDNYPDIPRAPTSQDPEPGTEELGPDEIGDTADPLTEDRAVAPRGYLDPDHGFDNMYRGRMWAVQGQRILLHRGQLVQDDDDAARGMAEFGDAIARYADDQYISRASLFALMYAETECFAPPDLVPGDETAGPLNVSASLCMAMNPGQTHDQCLQLLTDQPSYGISTVVRYLASPTMRRIHHNDPVLLAAAYRTGSLRYSNANPWHLASPPDYLTTFVSAYNAYRTWEAHGRAAPAERGMKIEGGQLFRGHTKFRARGISLTGTITPPVIANANATSPSQWINAYQRITNDRSGEFDQFRGWHVNTLRFQVSQPGLFTSPTRTSADVDAYIQFVNDTVRAARDRNFTVIVSMRNEWPASEFYPTDGVGVCPSDEPCDDTNMAWRRLIMNANALSNGGVILEVFNEPSTHHPDAWSGWQSAHTSVIHAVRNAGANNLLVVEGTDSGRYMPRDEAHALESVDHNIMYGIHPYPLAGTFDGEGDWDDAFGNFCTHHTHACLATEWIAIGKDNVCYDERDNMRHFSPALSLAMHRYLRHAHIGSVIWPGDRADALVYTANGAMYPTRPTAWGNRCAFTCAREDAVGPGEEIKHYFQKGRLAAPLVCH